MKQFFVKYFYITIACQSNIQNSINSIVLLSNYTITRIMRMKKKIQRRRDAYPSPKPIVFSRPTAPQDLNPTKAEPLKTQTSARLSLMKKKSTKGALSFTIEGFASGENCANNLIAIGKASWDLGRSNCFLIFPNQSSSVVFVEPNLSCNDLLTH